MTEGGSGSRQWYWHHHCRNTQVRMNCHRIPYWSLYANNGCFHNIGTKAIRPLFYCRKTAAPPHQYIGKGGIARNKWLNQDVKKREYCVLSTAINKKAYRDTVAGWSACPLLGCRKSWEDSKAAKQRQLAKRRDPDCLAVRCKRILAESSNRKSNIIMLMSPPGPVWSGLSFSPPRASLN